MVQRAAGGSRFWHGPALAQSRTLRGTGATGVATIGAVSVEATHEVLTEVRDAVLPLVPYMDTLRWVFIAMASAGVAVAVWRGRKAQWSALMWGSLAVGLLARLGVRQVEALALAALTTSLFLLNLRRAGERAAERLDQLEISNVTHRQMLDAAARRPRSCDALLDYRAGQRMSARGQVGPG